MTKSYASFVISYCDAAVFCFMQARREKVSTSYTCYCLNAGQQMLS